MFSVERGVRGEVVGSDESDYSTMVEWSINWTYGGGRRRVGMVEGAES